MDRGAVIDTGYACRVDSVTKAMVVTGPPAGIVSIGGYRFSLRELQDTSAGSTLAPRSPRCPIRWSVTV